MKSSYPEEFRWRFYCILILFFFLIIGALKWSLTPTFIDIYYHLSVVSGFEEAGGFVQESFWEYAPIGRPHLYPPLLHFLMLIFYKIGVPLLFIGRLFEFIIYPLLLFTLYKLISNLFSRRLAFFSLLVGSSVYSFYLSVINFIPASLALILGLLSYLCIEKRKILTAAILLGLSFYAHPGIPWFFVVSIIIYGILNRERLKDSLVTIVSSLVLAGSLLAHEYNFRSFVSLSMVYENFLLEFNLWVFLGAIPAIFIALRNKKRFYIFLALFIAGMLMLLTKYKYRYLCGHGILGLIFLSALSLDILYGKFSEYLVHKKKSLFLLRVLFIIIVLFCAASPAIQIRDGSFKFVAINSTYASFMPSYSDFSRGNEVSIYFAKFWKEIAEIVKDNSGSEDIIYCNMSYSGGLLSILSNRVSSTAMLQEVKPFKAFDPIVYSRLIIWIKNPEGSPEKELFQVIDRYNLKKIEETDIAYIYENPFPHGSKRRAESIVPNWVIYSILSVLGGLIIYDNKIRKNA